MRLNQILRRLLQLPVFTTVAVLTLAVGIGANTAIFSVIEGVLIKPLPYPRPDELVVLDHAAPGINLKSGGAAPFLYFTYREEGRVFRDVALVSGDTVSVTGLAEPEEVAAIDVTEDFLPMLGATPALGRLFTKEDVSPKSAETVVLTAGYWRSRFGGDSSVIGRRVLLDGRARDIIGVLSDSFRFLDPKPELVLPLRLNREKTFLGQFSFVGIARLKPGATIEQATADVARMIPLALSKFPPFPGYSLKMFEDAKLEPNLRSLKNDVVGDIGSVLWVLMGTIGMVLLIACANEQQVRAERRSHGASRGRIAYELLTESVVLGLVGGAAGLGVAYGAIRVLIALAPGNLPRLDNIAIDGVVLSFTFVVSIVAGLLFGAIPVLKYAGLHPAAGLRGAGRGAGTSRDRYRARSTLVVAQVGLALVLLVGSGLMIRTFNALRHVNPGFSNPNELLTFRLSIPGAQVKEPEAVIRMHQAIMEKVASIPGVTSVGLSSLLPMTESGWHDPIFAADKNYEQTELPPLRSFKFVSPGLLKTMGNTIVAGRDFTWQDAYDKRPVAMVSENLARELWGQPSAALGKQIRESLKTDWREVVGVVSDERDEGVDKKAPTVAFFPMLMTAFEGDDPFLRRSATYVIRSKRTGTLSFRSEVSSAVWSINPNLPLANVRTLESVVRASLARTSFTLVMLVIAGSMALILGVAGIYGVISYSVSQRTREIGIRMALGAERLDVTRMFVRYGLALTAIGVVWGLSVAMALTRLMGSMLFDVSPIDPFTYVAVCASLIAVACLASYLPALRATLVNPVTALRAE